MGGAQNQGTASNPTSVTGNTATSDAGTPQQVSVSNVQRFAGGALVSAPTLAVVGDSASGGSQKEGILPLGDPEAMRSIAQAIAEHMPQAGKQHQCEREGDDLAGQLEQGHHSDQQAGEEQSESPEVE